MEVNLRDDGLLWLINRVVFHPRGFALAVSDDRFTLLGDGSEVWQFAIDEDAKFDAVEATFGRARNVNDAN